ncbi:MAG TPA: MBL fold metallo-hydrolase [Pseudonocardia sp.]|jgi:7,8-dihydropterin-6-yl-methyl-4-(beta-D-ribofuranosyl)aminobenzene 5'-phosphate synthase|nr:MBL fold metallo-hydrolase [Pseudonocardia sp.]
MCDGLHAHPHEVVASVPRLASGDAVDPINLEPVDEVRITTLVDNVYDALLPDQGPVTRAGFTTRDAPAPQFEGGFTTPGLVAEHGFSALVTIRRGTRETTVLFDTGLSPDAMVTNADRLGVPLSDIQAVVLSHGHFDHAGGLAGLRRKLGARSMPMVVHPGAWTRRRLAIPGREPHELPTLSKRALAGEGFEVIERREPSLLVDGCVLITGEVDRVTEFERGMPPPHQAWTGSGWEHDPLVLDDQALIVHLRDRGLVILTGCGHAGVVNIVRHASRLTGVSGLHALVGGFHLSGPAFEPIIGNTVTELAALSPALLAPGHCTGWRAQHALAAALPDAWIASSSGTTYALAATGS